ncbi:MAG: hypothetical protein R6X34_19645 [Chloroflexota bacterium]
MKRPFSFLHNNQIHIHVHKPALTRLSLLGLMGFFLFFVLGCSLLNPDSNETAPAEGEAPPAQQAMLVCSDECAARGQCGHLVSNDQPVILGHPERPAVQEHQLTFPSDTPLPVLGIRDEIVQSVTTSEQFSHPFYLVQRADSQTGWVAGWCTNLQ